MAWCTHLDIGNGDIPDHIKMIIDDGNRRDSLAIHLLKGVGQRLVTTARVSIDLILSADSLDRDDLMGSDRQVFQVLRIQLINHRKAAAVLPEEFDQSELAEDSHHFILVVLVDNNHAMNSASERLNCL